MRASRHHITPLTQSPYLRAGPDPRHVSQLAAEARYLFPGLSIQQVVGDSCVTLNTPDKFAPFLNNPRPGLVIAGAGCGHGAKGADEIGQSCQRDSTVQCSYRSSLSQVG